MDAFRTFDIVPARRGSLTRIPFAALVTAAVVLVPGVIALVTEDDEVELLGTIDCLGIPVPWSCGGLMTRCGGRSMVVCERGSLDILDAFVCLMAGAGVAVWTVPFAIVIVFLIVGVGNDELLLDEVL